MLKKQNEISKVVNRRRVLELLSVAVLKHQDQRSLGEERV